MRARIVLTGIIMITAAACSGPDADPAVDAALDARAADPDLALSERTETVPVASDVEVHQPEPAPLPTPRVVTPEEADLEIPEPEPLSSDRDGGIEAAPALGVAAVPVDAHVHPRAEEPTDAVSGPSVEGGGKPTGVSTGLGPVPDASWGDTGIIDDPNPMPGMGGLDGTGTTGVIGRGGAVIIRGGAGGMHDDCKIHPRGGGMVAGNPSPPPPLVNDRDPRRGSLINERAPRTSRSPSLPRGGGFPRGGIR